MPPILITILLSMAPISELRGGIPYAWSQSINPWLAYLIAVIGNLIPVIPLLLLLGPLSKALRRFKVCDKFFDWWFQHTLRRSKLIEKYETLGLMVFVMIPLPITGAWTGSVAAFLLGIRLKLAFPAIAAGVILAGIIVSLVCLGVVHIPIFIRH